MLKFTILLFKLTPVVTAPSRSLQAEDLFYGGLLGSIISPRTLPTRPHSHLVVACLKWYANFTLNSPVEGSATSVCPLAKADLQEAVR